MNPDLLERTMARLSAAEIHLRAIGHDVPHTPETEKLRWLVEFAGAFCREGWIAADGQNAATPEEVAKRCLASMKMVQTVTARVRAEGVVL